MNIQAWTMHDCTIYNLQWLINSKNIKNTVLGAGSYVQPVKEWKSFWETLLKHFCCSVPFGESGSAEMLHFTLKNNNYYSQMNMTVKQKIAYFLLTFIATKNCSYHVLLWTWCILWGSDLSRVFLWLLTGPIKPCNWLFFLICNGMCLF